jgi:hypothetical protein
MRLRSLFMLVASAAGLATFGLSAPASAATAPTISAPASRTGFGPITITGTAAAGATVTLIEAAYIFRGDMNPAVDYGTGGIVTATADGAGHYTIQRLLDSGFVFAVEADGLRSPVIQVSIQVLPALTVTATGNGTVNVDVAADPSQPGLPVQVQRRNGAAWVVEASGYTDQHAVFSATLTGQAPAVYRAYIGADPLDGVLANYSDTVDSTGAVVIPAPTTPTTPAPKAGDVQITKIVYDSPGRDTGSTTSLNAEYVRLTNKTGRTIDLKNWTLRDAAAHIYKFSATYSLGAGKVVYIRTGRGTNGKPSSNHRYWARTGYVWNNGGDTGTLRSSTGKTIDTCKYRTGSGTTYC